MSNFKTNCCWELDLQKWACTNCQIAISLDFGFLLQTVLDNHAQLYNLRNLPFTCSFLVQIYKCICTSSLSLNTTLWKTCTRLFHNYSTIAKASLLNYFTGLNIGRISIWDTYNKVVNRFFFARLMVLKYRISVAIFEATKIKASSNAISQPWSYRLLKSSTPLCWTKMGKKSLANHEH